MPVRQGKALRHTLGKGHPPASAIRWPDLVAGFGLPVALAASSCGSIKMLLGLQPRVNAGGLRPDDNRSQNSLSFRNDEYQFLEDFNPLPIAFCIHMNLHCYHLQVD
ncbi:MAG: hypothetical protein OXN97_13500 [Bryobacterales bacterium]|nr:hypothetical protein [Bryobacterales bacterium]MDE0629456.1 hypothetical protein [Bryobacterales bacterium]